VKMLESLRQTGLQLHTSLASIGRSHHSIPTNAGEMVRTSKSFETHNSQNVERQDMTTQHAFTRRLLPRSIKCFNEEGAGDDAYAVCLTMIACSIKSLV
jgi:hypothetical protein